MFCVFCWKVGCWNDSKTRTWAPHDRAWRARGAGRALHGSGCEDGIIIVVQLLCFIVLYVFLFCVWGWNLVFRKGGWYYTVGNPHRAQTYQFELLELALLLKLDKQLPVEQLEATVSLSTVPYIYIYIYRERERERCSYYNNIVCCPLVETGQAVPGRGEPGGHYRILQQY